MEQEQEMNALDLEKLRIEKENLSELIKPAIDQFIKNTGFWPNIRMSQISEQTKCGTITSPLKIEIFITI